MVNRTSSGFFTTKTQVQNFSTNTDKPSTISRKPVNQATNSGSGHSFLSGTESDVALVPRTFRGPQTLERWKGRSPFNIHHHLHCLQTSKPTKGRTRIRRLRTTPLHCAMCLQWRIPLSHWKRWEELWHKTGIQSPPPALALPSNHVTTSNPTSSAESGNFVEIQGGGTPIWPLILLSL